MKAKRYTEEQIIGFLKAHEVGAKLSDLIREHGFSEQSFEPHRDFRRLRILRGLEHEQSEAIFPGG